MPPASQLPRPAPHHSWQLRVHIKGDCKCKVAQQAAGSMVTEEELPCHQKLEKKKVKKKATEWVSN